jgi:hypothetical protein
MRNRSFQNLPSVSPTTPPKSYFGNYAAVVVANGYSCLPVALKSKQINWSNWNFFCAEVPSPKQIALWQHRNSQHGLAIPAGWSCIAVDIDSLDVIRAKHLERLARCHLGNSPLKRIGQYPKRLLVYAVSQGHVIPSSSVCDVDLIGDNRYFVAFNLHPKTGRPYRWVEGSPATVPRQKLPAVTPSQVERFMAAVREQFGQSGRAPTKLTSVEVNRLNPDSRTSPVLLTMDGRDGLLTRLIWSAYARHDTPESIATDAWANFAAQADPSRPKRDGQRLWSFADALSKARYVIASGKPRPSPSINPRSNMSSTDEWSGARDRFAQRINRLCVQGQLTRIDAAVSHAMLAFIDSPERSCFASCETISARVRCRPATVKKARRQLRQLDLWKATQTKGGRGILAHYRPCITDSKQ